MPQITLPTDKDVLARVIETIITSGKAVRNVRRVEWLLDSYYLQGARHFSGVNYNLGTIIPRYQNSNTDVDFRFEKIVRKYNDELGRRLRVDVTPEVSRDNNFSLDGLRKAAMAQATLRIICRDVRTEEVKRQAVMMQLQFGTGALACWGQQDVRLDRFQPVVEVVPPWQLLPIPANPNVIGELQGIMRYRRVSYDWVKSKDGLKLPKDRSSLKLTAVKYGENPEHMLTGFESGGSADGWVHTDDKGSGGKLAVDYGDLAEVFINDYNQTLVRYVVYFAGVVVRDVDFTKVAERPMMPLYPFWDIPVGGFYGRSFVSLLRPMNVEVEYLYKSLMNNAQELDQFGFLMMPRNMGINQNDFKTTTKPRVVWYEPDLTVPEHRPFNIAPANTGDWPGKVAMMGEQVLDAMSGQTGMMQGEAPGRVDSASALGMLYETSSIPLGGPMDSLAQAFCGVYKALLGVAREKWSRKELVDITMLDDSIVGCIIDPASGKLVLDSSNIPHPTEVDIKIRSQLPKSPMQRKQELVSMLQLGLVTPRQFRRINYREGLDFPLDNRAEYENWRKATLYNVILFNDGQTPGLIEISDTADDPEVQLEAIQDFMARPEFMLASKEVRMAFEQRKTAYVQIIGGMYPQQLPYPEQMAQMAMAGGGMGSPPMAGIPPEAMQGASQGEMNETAGE